MRDDSKIRKKLPVHAYEDGKNLRAHVLRVDGQVGRFLNLTRAELEELPQQDLGLDITCLVGWTVPDLKWSGVPLETILLLAEPSPEARYDR